jgi:hypothetical protein
MGSWYRKSLPQVKASSDLNAEGGYDPTPENMDQFEHADLITLPSNVSGTNCGNCKFLKKIDDKMTCDHPDLEGIKITDRNCCRYWDHKNVHRAWGEPND